MCANEKKYKVKESDNTNLAELLDKGHQRGIKSIRTKILQYATKEQPVVICKAIVILKDESEFTGHAEASQENVNEKVTKFLVAMAETRAIDRALRWATNTPKTALEEMKTDESHYNSDEKWTPSQEKYFNDIKHFEYDGEILDKVNRCKKKIEKTGYLTKAEIGPLLGEMQEFIDNNKAA